MKLVVASSIALLITLPVLAQFDSGQISGFVRDPSGGVVPGSSIVVSNEGSNEQHKTRANTEGYYVFPQLMVGRYSVSVEAPGFKRYTKTGIVIDAQSKIAADVTLTVGAVSDSVEVAASSSQVQTDSATVGNSGAAGVRFALVTASPRRRPDVTCGNDDTTVANDKAISPLSCAGIDCPPPL